jgi:hypothetical protein
MSSHPELPIVARILVEIRSDGTRTVASASVQNALLGQAVSVQAETTTPNSIAQVLLRSMARMPLLGTVASRALLRSGLVRDLADPTSRG